MRGPVEMVGRGVVALALSVWSWDAMIHRRSQLRGARGGLDPLVEVGEEGVRVGEGGRVHAVGGGEMG